MEILEAKRSVLERLEVIENAISERIRRNPELYYSYYEEQRLVDKENHGLLPPVPASDISANRIHSVKKSRRSRKQIVLQQHEIDRFLEEYQREVARLHGIKLDKDDSESAAPDFEQLEKAVKDAKSRYADEGRTLVGADVESVEHSMFSSSTSTHKDILSTRARDLDINQLFARDEHYGEFLLLEPFHHEWLNVVKDGSVTALQFMNVMEMFVGDAYLVAPAVNRGSKKYQDFVGSLLGYMSEFFRKTYPLVNHSALGRRLAALFDEYLQAPVADETKGLFCIPCGRWFKLETVYKSHLSGKKHSKNLAKGDGHLLAEYKLHKYCGFLVQTIANTRAFVERNRALTADERAQELERLAKEYEAPAYGQHETEDAAREKQQKREPETDDDGNPFNLPLGPDGYPIPYWLYKLQGLDIEYSCEICSNHTYKGRRYFDKHFSEARHIFGLRCLGIEPSATFKGITKIQEAKDLWARIQTPVATGVGVGAGAGAGAIASAATAAATPSAAKLEIEVEDEEGNVMSEKLYHELKRQGLL